MNPEPVESGGGGTSPASKIETSLALESSVIEAHIEADQTDHVDQALVEEVELTMEERREKVETAFYEKLSGIVQVLKDVGSGGLNESTYSESLRDNIAVLNCLLPQRNLPPASERIAHLFVEAILSMCQILDKLQAGGFLEVRGGVFQAGDQHMILAEYIPHYQSCLDTISRVYGNTSEVIKKRAAAQDTPVDENQVHREVKKLRETVSAARSTIEIFRNAHQNDHRRRKNNAKKSLAPDVEESVNEEVRSFVASNLPSREQEETKQAVRAEIEAILRTKWPKCILHIFGSSGSGLGFASADMDLCLEVEVPKKEEKPRKSRSQKQKDGVVPDTDATENGQDGVEVEEETNQDEPIKDGGAGEGEGEGEDGGEKEGGEGSERDVQKEKQRIEAQIVLALEELFTSHTYKDKFSKVETIPTARVPIAKVRHASSNIECDICVNNTLAIHNTRLLKTYSLLDERFVQLAFVIKHWAKKRGIGDPSNCTLSSYALVNMLIFYLQQCSPPVLCNLQNPGLCRTPGSQQAPGVTFCVDVEAAKKQMSFSKPNRKSVAALLFGFFNFFAYDFDFKGRVVAIGRDSNLDKRDYKASTMARKWRIAIQDPLEQPHDLGSVIYDPVGMMLIISEFERAHELLQGGKFLEVVCQPRPDIKAIDKSCMTCGAKDHTLKDCPLGFGSCCINCGATGHQLRDCPEPPSKDRGACNRCGQFGHWSRECKAQPREDTRTCHRCGQPGHLSRDCPMGRYGYRGMPQMNPGQPIHLPMQPPMANRSTGPLLHPLPGTPGRAQVSVGMQPGLLARPGPQPPRNHYAPYQQPHTQHMSQYRAYTTPPANPPIILPHQNINQNINTYARPHAAVGYGIPRPQNINTPRGYGTYPQHVMGQYGTQQTRPTTYGIYGPPR
eukprot:comp23575_c0_seq2/m.39937 comp23575_c0_seq2/g.39937  ORF comp23575_c0_seq2/g.39937 comp23575_c0_seq2/m.39937 type:complete len:899 (-) comp23575_c0_seq2:162-2858(-)